MRTTLDIDDAVMEQVKKRAAERHEAIRDIVEEALRAYLNATRPHAPCKLQWQTEGGGLRPGIDLEDRNSMLDSMGPLQDR